MSMTRHNLIFWAAAVASLAIAAPAAGQFSVEPVIVRLDSDRGAVERTIRLRNEGTAPREFRVHLADFEQGANGGHEFLPPGTNANSCAARLSVFPERVALLPTEEQEIRLRLAEGFETCWSLILVESVSTGVGGIRYGEQIGVKVFGGSSTATLEASITQASAEVSDATLTVALTMENQSSVPVQSVGVIEIRSAGGELVLSVDVTAFSVLPGRTRDLLVESTVELAAGDYLVVPILDFGGEYLAAAQASLQVR